MQDLTGASLEVVHIISIHVLLTRTQAHGLTQQQGRLGISLAV